MDPYSQNVAPAGPQPGNPFDNRSGVSFSLKIALTSAAANTEPIVITRKLYSLLTNRDSTHSRRFVFQPYKFNADEVRAFKECNRESFYQRSLPIGTFLGLGTFYAVKAGL
jgi:hypothetical protein